MFDEDQIDSEDETWLDRFTIPQTHHVYHTWKILSILMCFFTSFDYAQQAALPLKPSKKDDANWEILYGVFFFVDLLLNFLKDEDAKPSQLQDRRAKQIAIAYLKGRFAFDLIALLPLKWLAEVIFGMEPSYSKLLLLFKLMRLYTGFSLLNYKVYKRQIKSIVIEKINRLNQLQSKKVHSPSYRKTNISYIIGFSHMIKTLQLVTYILCGSFFTGIFWYIFCVFTKEIPSKLDDSADGDNFIDQFAITSEEKDMAITLTYFAFTTLSTVGLGDYHPRSNAERFFGAFVLLIGVSLTSYIMENFNQMLMKIKEFNKPFDQTSELSQFLGTMERYNADMPLPKKMIQNIDKYFEYRWANDKNYAMTSASDSKIFRQLPSSVQSKICKQFLFKDFLRIYRRYFQTFQIMDKKQFQKRKTFVFYKAQSIRFGSVNLKLQYLKELELQESINEFQMMVLRALEPQEISFGEDLFCEKDSVNSILFLMEGSIEVGYNHSVLLFKQGLKTGFDLQSREITSQPSMNFLSTFTSQIKVGISKLHQNPKNKKYRFPIAFEPGQVCGLYEVLFDAQSKFLYRTMADCQLYFIRRKNWKFIEKRTQAGGLKGTIDNFKKSALINYIDKFYFPIQQSQSQLLGMAKKYQFHKKKTNQMLGKQIVHRMKSINARKRKESGISVNLDDLDETINRSTTRKLLNESIADGEFFSRALTKRVTERLENDVEDTFKKQESKLIDVIRWNNNIDDPDLRKQLNSVFEGTTPVGPSIDSLCSDQPLIPATPCKDDPVACLNLAMSRLEWLEDRISELLKDKEIMEGQLGKLIEILEHSQAVLDERDAQIVELTREHSARMKKVPKAQKKSSLTHSTCISSLNILPVSRASNEQEGQVQREPRRLDQKYNRGFQPHVCVEGVSPINQHVPIRLDSSVSDELEPELTPSESLSIQPQSSSRVFKLRPNDPQSDPASMSLPASAAGSHHMKAKRRSSKLSLPNMVKPNLQTRRRSQAVGASEQKELMKQLKLEQIHSVQESSQFAQYQDKQHQSQQHNSSGGTHETPDMQRKKSLRSNLSNQNFFKPVRILMNRGKLNDKTRGRSMSQATNQFEVHKFSPDKLHENPRMDRKDRFSVDHTPVGAMSQNSGFQSPGRKFYMTRSPAIIQSVGGGSSAASSNHIQSLKNPSAFIAYRFQESTVKDNSPAGKKMGSDDLLKNTDDTVHKRIEEIKEELKPSDEEGSDEIEIDKNLQKILKDEEMKNTNQMRQLHLKLDLQGITSPPPKVNMNFTRATIFEDAQSPPPSNQKNGPSLPDDLQFGPQSMTGAPPIMSDLADLSQTLLASPSKQEE